MSSLKLRTFFADYYKPLRLRGRSGGAERLHLNTIKNLEKFLSRPAALADLDDDTLSRFACWMSERGRVAVTINGELNRLRAQWRFANRKGFVSTWPDIQDEIVPEREPRAWLQDELAKLLIAAGATEGTIEGIPAGLWWRAIVLACYGSGERVGAIRQLKWQHVDLERGWLSIPAGLRKGRRKFKSFAIHPDALDALKAIRTPEREFVFPWPLHFSSLYNHLGRILIRAGLPHDRDSKFHRIRKTSASYYEAAGGNATELLGHSNRKVTERYLDPRVCGGPTPATLLPRVG